MTGTAPISPMHHPIFRVIRPQVFDPLDFQIHMGVKFEDGSMHVAQPVTMVSVKPGELPPDQPMLRIEGKFAEAAFQSLLDQLWNLGFRPSADKTIGVDAQRLHLDDMRKLVAKTYGVELA